MAKYVIMSRRIGWAIVTSVSSSRASSSCAEARGLCTDAAQQLKACLTGIRLTRNLAADKSHDNRVVMP